MLISHITSLCCPRAWVCTSWCRDKFRTTASATRLQYLAAKAYSMACVSLCFTGDLLGLTALGCERLELVYHSPVWQINWLQHFTSWMPRTLGKTAKRQVNIPQSYLQLLAVLVVNRHGHLNVFGRRLIPFVKIPLNQSHVDVIAHIPFRKFKNKQERNEKQTILRGCTSQGFRFILFNFINITATCNLICIADISLLNK